MWGIMWEEIHEDFEKPTIIGGFWRLVAERVGFELMVRNIVRTASGPAV